MNFERKKILVMTDSPKIDTGFGRVGREVWSYLSSTGKYEVRSIGWFHQENNREVPYHIHTTKKNEKGIITQEDKYGHHSFPVYVDGFKPDLVWTLGDMWMTDHVKNAPNRKSFKWVGYFPIDGEPVPSKWGEIVGNMDVAVAYGKYGRHVIGKRTSSANLKYIYHGVNSKLFKPAPEAQRTMFKKQLLGVTDKKIIGIVARNQPRKAFDCLFQMFYHVLNGEWYKCGECGEITASGYDVIERSPIEKDRCRSCNSDNLKKGSPRNDIILYLHCAPKDCGWELIDLQEDFNLRGNIIFNPDLQIGRGVAENSLAAIYNAIDIFTLPTRGEGFGLPVLEAMSCGRPVVATDYSAHPEWARGASILVKPKVLESEPLTNIRRAVIDMDEYVSAMVNLLGDEKLQKDLGIKARKVAESMDWSIINRQWEELIDSVLFPDGAPKNISYTDVKFNPEAV
jgi:glycosyltransferase involved in cell wall biosynthesis